VPEYFYECQNCEHSFEIFQHIKARRKRKCPECGKLKLERLIQRTFGFMGGCKTVGSLAEKNASKMSDEQKKELLDKQKTKKFKSRSIPRGHDELATPPKPKVPWWRKDDPSIVKKVAKMDQKQTEKYIATGKS
jgi:putative FmdB family regulatory protein